MHISRHALLLSSLLSGIRTAGDIGTSWTDSYKHINWYVLLTPIFLRSSYIAVAKPTPSLHSCPKIFCPNGKGPEWDPVTKTCHCKEDIPDPSTCPTIKCTSKTHPVYHSESKTCSCEPSPPVCPTTIVCASGCHTVQNTSTKACTCEVTNPIPKTCPQFRCVADYHVVYNLKNDNCGCEPNCPDLFCISEQHPTMDYATNTCSCQWIEGLEPLPVIEARKAQSTTVASSRPTGFSSSCPGLFCISEQHPVFNTTTGKCECEWISGFGPVPMKHRPTPILSLTSIVPSSPTATPISLPTPLCEDIVCISEMEPVYNFTSKICECQWIPGLQPSLVGTPISTPAPL